jgi:hypothetical protein
VEVCDVLLCPTLASARDVAHAYSDDHHIRHWWRAIERTISPTIYCHRNTRMVVNRSDQGGDAMRLNRFGLLGCVVVVALLSFGFTAHAPRNPAPRLTDPTATASPLVNRFFNLIEHNDVKGLQRLLSPAFQLERADGSGGTKTEYLANLPAITNFSISDLKATQTGSVLIVRYQATIEGVVNGKPATPGPAPRLSVFSRNGKTWRLIAHANFNPLTG